MIDAIVTKIEEMIDIHGTLNELARKKTQAIIQGDMKTLDHIVNQEEAATQKLAQLEDERVRLVQDFTKDTGRGTTFTALIEQAPESEREKLQHLQARLAENVFDLKHQNDLNQDLLKQSLEWVRVNVNLFNPKPQNPNYTNPKAQQKSPGEPLASRFDSRA